MPRSRSRPSRSPPSSRSGAWSSPPSICCAPISRSSSGEPRQAVADLDRAAAAARWPVVLLVAALLLTGFAPGYFLSYLTPTIQALLPLTMTPPRLSSKSSSCMLGVFLLLAESFAKPDDKRWMAQSRHLLPVRAARLFLLHQRQPAAGAMARSGSSTRPIPRRCSSSASRSPPPSSC